jgi:hypothetical protein
LPFRDSPGGQAQGSFRHGGGRLKAAVCTGFGLKGCLRREKKLFLSGGAFE